MILRTMAEDSTRYFLVIATSHLVVQLTLNLGRVSATISLSGLQPITPDISVSLGINPTCSGFVSCH